MKDITTETIKYYDSNAESFFSDTVEADMSFCIGKFVKYFTENSKSKKKLNELMVLDAGCGSGRDSKTFLEMGFQVEAFDASKEIVAKASDYTGIQVKQLYFEDFSEKNKYDGIWACASLLHVERDNLIPVLKNMKDALKPNGVMYASFKYGNTERVKGDRFFCDMNEELVKDYFDAAGLSIEEMFITGDVREDRGQEKWINLIAKKVL